MAGSPRPQTTCHRVLGWAGVHCCAQSCKRHLAPAHTANAPGWCLLKHSPPRIIAGPAVRNGREQIPNRSGSRASTTCPRPPGWAGWRTTRQSTNGNQGARSQYQLPTVQPVAVPLVVGRFWPNPAESSYGEKPSWSHASWLAVKAILATVPAGCQRAGIGFPVSQAIPATPSAGPAGAQGGFQSR